MGRRAGVGKIESKTTQYEAYRLRIKEHKSYEEIADNLKLSGGRSSAYRCVEAVILELKRNMNSVKEERILQLEQAMSEIAGLIGTSPDMHKLYLDDLKEINKLEGNYAPAKLALTDPSGTQEMNLSNDEIIRRIRSLELGSTDS